MLRPIALVAVPLLAASAAAAPSSAVWPAMQRDALDPAGDEALLFDVATIPQTTYRLDALNQPVPSFRLAQWANLGTRPLVGEKVRVVLNFRYDLDTSATPREVAAFPLLGFHRFSLLTGYLELDATPDVSVRLGRQLYADLADFLAFDGGRVAWTLPVPLRLELYGGLRPAIGVPDGQIASSLYELDGVAQVTGLQPIAGATLRWTGDLVSRREASLGYRHSWRTTERDRELDPSLPEGLATTAAELVGAAAGDVGPVHVAAGFAYSLAVGRLMRARGAVTRRFTEALTAGLEYQRYEPTFALDSIWNFFSSQPFDELGATAAWRPFAALRLEGRLFGRLFHTATVNRFGDAFDDPPGLLAAFGTRVGGVWFAGGTLFDSWLSWQDGTGGRRILLDSGVRQPLADAVELFARLTLLTFQQDLRRSQGGPALGLVAGVTWRLPAGAGLSLLLEENLNAFASPVPRVLAMFDLARWL